MKFLFGGSALLLFYMASCNYIPVQQIMLNNVFLLNKPQKIGLIRLDECNFTLLEGLKTLTFCGEILISHPK